jgi:hypothetical protein
MFWSKLCSSSPECGAPSAALGQHHQPSGVLVEAASGSALQCEGYQTVRKTEADQLLLTCRCLELSGIPPVECPPRLTPDIDANGNLTAGASRTSPPEKSNKITITNDKRAVSKAIIERMARGEVQAGVTRGAQPSTDAKRTLITRLPTCNTMNDPAVADKPRTLTRSRSTVEVDAIVSWLDAKPGG